jgi:hypothetical protein
MIDPIRFLLMVSELFPSSQALSLFLDHGAQPDAVDRHKQVRDLIQNLTSVTFNRPLKKISFFFSFLVFFRLP